MAAAVSFSLVCLFFRGFPPSLASVIFSPFFYLIFSPAVQLNQPLFILFPAVAEDASDLLAEQSRDDRDGGSRSTTLLLQPVDERLAEIAAKVTELEHKLAEINPSASSR